MALLAEIHEGHQIDMAEGFEQIAGPASRLVGQVFEAAIRRSLEEENPAKADRMQMMFREFEEGRNAS